MVKGRRTDKKKRRLWFFKAAAEIKERQATVLILLQYGYWGLLHYKAEFVAAEQNINTGEQSLEEQLYNSIILIDEDENEIEFDIMDIIEHNGENYYVLLPVDDDSDELEYVILRETGEGEEKTLVGIDDEKTLDDVFKKYQKHSTDEN